MSTITRAENAEPFRNLRVTSEILKIPLFKLRRAAKSGAFPTYKIGNKRALVRISEVVAAIENSHRGAGK